MPRPRASGSTSSSRSLATRLRLLHEEHGADDLAVALGDPAALARRIEVVEEVGADARDQRLELGVVAPLARVERAVAMDDPAHVARLVRRAADTAPRVGRAARRAEQPLRSSPIASTSRALVRVGQPAEQRRRPRRGRALRAARTRRGPSRVRRSRLWRAVGRTTASRPIRPLRFEAAQDAAQIAGVEPEIAAEVGGGRRLAVGQLVEHAQLGQRERAVEVAVAERADLAGVEAVEGADGVDRGCGHDVDIVNELVDGVNDRCACRGGVAT